MSGPVDAGTIVNPISVAWWRRARIGQHLVAAVTTIVLAGAVVLGAGSVAHHLTWNLSPSLPRGLYLLHRGAVPRRQSIVAFPVPAMAAATIAARRYLLPGALLLKRIVALSGDRVSIDDRSFVVNGTLIGPVAGHDSAGRPLTPFRFSAEVPRGFALVATTSHLSFDSRYFGPVPITALIVATPLWTY